VELHGGTVALTREFGKGTQVRLEIPRNGAHGTDRRQMTKP
jgi:signal transduction histidine kinase